MDLNFRTEHLPRIRSILESQSFLRETLGPVAQYVFVVDANVIVRGILWVVGKRQDKSAQPGLFECVIAETIVAYITQRVADEVSRVLVEAAAKKGLSAEECLAQWRMCKDLFRIGCPDVALVEKYREGRDPTDAETLALAETLGARGIVSVDPDIEAMGGRVIGIEFIDEVRDYSRKACVSLPIEIGGCYVVGGTVAAVETASTLVRKAIDGFSRMPDAVKLLCVAVLVIILLNEKSRTAALRSLGDVGKRMRELAPQVISTVMELAEQAIENRAVAPVLPTA